jgi:GNAT superfamily N-acetyltransferase
MTIYLDLKLINEIDKIDYEYTYSRMKGIENISGNPFKISFYESDNANGLLAEYLPIPHFNRVIIFNKNFENEVEEIFEFYKNKDFTIEIPPGCITEDISKKLMRKGYSHTSFNPILFSEITKIEKINNKEIEIEEIKTKEKFEEFSHIYLNAWEINKEMHEAIKRNINHWLDIPNWHLYISKISNESAGISILYIKDEIGYLADTAIIPKFRGKGIQKELISHRVKEALSKGCKKIMGRAEFGSISQRNMETLGIKVSYTKSIWSKIN